jgi:hypothetical protein
MIPTIGRIVHYTLTDHDVAQIAARRTGAGDKSIGNTVTAGDVFPLMITRVWGPTEESAVNGQVFLDGDDVLWVTSRQQGDGPSTWREPERV